MNLPVDGSPSKSPPQRKPLRVAMVTRRYWPLASGSGTIMAHLAAGLLVEGVRCTIITPRWNPSWPQSMTHGAATVVRLPISSYRTWRDMRYGWTLSTFLRRHADEFNLIYVSELKHEAAAASAAGQRLGWPVVLRAENSGFTGDCHWQLNAPLGRRIKQHCGRAAALLASSPIVHRELIAAGFPRERIHLVPSGIPALEESAAEDRAAYRAAFAEADTSLALPKEAALVVFIGRLTEDKGLPDLLRAWSLVTRGRPHARLWLVGEGPEQQRLADLTASLGISDSVVLPGVFDAPQDILRAADLFVYPVLEAGTALAPLEAMAAGVPVVASDIPDNRHMLADGRCGVLVPPEDPTALASAIARLLDSREAAQELSRAAQSRVREEFSLEAMVRHHAELFRQLVA